MPRLVPRRALLKSTLLGLAGLAAVACSKSDKGQSEATASPSAAAATAPKRPRLAVVPKSASSSFWLAVERGVKQAAKELGCDVVYTAPVDEANYTEQINIVANFKTEKVDGMILAPSSGKSLLQPVRDFRNTGRPVVIMDSGLEGQQGKDFASFVGTENKAAGVAAGKALLGQLGENKQVVLFRFLENSVSTQSREAGFLEAAEQAGATVTSADQYSGSDVGQAKSKASGMVDLLVKAGGVFASNQISSLGMHEALRDIVAGGKLKPGQVKFVAFDAAPALVRGLFAGEVAGIVIQDPENMGFRAVETMLKVIRGKPVPKAVDTGSYVVTTANAHDPKVRAALVAYDKEIGAILDQQAAK